MKNDAILERPAIKRNVIAILLVAVLALLLVTLGILWFLLSDASTLNKLAPSSDNQLFQEELQKAVQRTAEVQNELENRKAHIISRAIALLPPDLEIEQAQHVTGSTVLISTRKVTDETDVKLTLWHVNTETNEVGKVDEIATGGPGASYGFTNDMESATFTFYQQWEGSYLQRRDFFTHTGSLLGKTTAYGGYHVEVEKDGVKLAIELAPAGVCTKNTPETDTTVQVTGVLVNGIPKAFKSPKTINCSRNDFYDAGLVEGDPDVRYSFGSVGYLLPENIGFVRVDVTKPLTTDSVKLN